MKLKRIGVLLLTICVVMSCMSLPARATEGNEAESEIREFGNRGRSQRRNRG